MISSVSDLQQLCINYQAVARAWILAGINEIAFFSARYFDLNPRRAIFLVEVYLLVCIICIIFS